MTAAAAVAAAMLPGAVAQAAGTEFLQNPSFELPGSNAAQPTGWQTALLEGETSPFRLVTQTFNAAGQFRRRRRFRMGSSGWRCSGRSVPRWACWARV
ncbi:hypothetical protein ACFQ1L_19170 [Phytohabitans flavus]|uniref:hypothetical protein n=1 Tax=Phytohabitans flavus TaxID=1076124 RepID=UPI00362CD408